MTAIDEDVSAGTETRVKPVRTLDKLNELLERKYPRLIKEGISEGAVLLPNAQLVAIWLTLHHNLYEGCVQVLTEQELPEDRRVFFITVSDYFCQFLGGIKVADAAIPVQTMEKFSNLMSRFFTECLGELALSLIDRKHDEDVVYWFLKLAFAWSELHGILLYYQNDKYRGTLPTIPDDPSASNLVYFLPFLTSTQWGQLESQIQSFGGTSCDDLFVALVGQKLKYLTLFEKNKNALDSSALLTSNIRAASKYIWSKLRTTSPDFWPGELCPIVFQNMGEDDLAEFAQGFVTRIPLLPKEPSYHLFPEDTAFHYALVMETIDAQLQTIMKTKFMRKHLRKVRKEVLSDENRMKLLRECAFPEDFPEMSKKVLENLLASTNELLTNLSSDGALEEKIDDADFCEELILPYVDFLSNLPLEEYPKSLNTVVFLTTLPCVIAVSHQGTQNLLNVLVSILNQSSVNFVGNEFMFSIHWVQLFKWFRADVHNFSSSANRLFSKIIFQNIYVSPKAISDFQEEFTSLTKKIKIASSFTPIGLTLLDFLTTEHKGTGKSKVASHIQEHIKLLMRAILKSLKKAQKSDEVKNCPQFLRNLFHSSWLLHRAVGIIHALSKEGNCDSEFVTSIDDFLDGQLEVTLNYLQAKPENEEDVNEDLCRRYAFAFLNGVARSSFKPKPLGFISKLWEAYVRNYRHTLDLGFNEIPVLLPRDIYVAASTEEFQEITQLVSNEFETQAGKTPYDETKLCMIAKLLQELLDVDLTPEKKTIRRLTIENILYTSLSITCQWNSSESCVRNVILPFVQFEVNLLRRRNALCSTNALSMCLTTITSAPLNDIADIKLYRKLFSLVGDLLNSITVHRLDVLSFRIHLYLQCFQSMVESITMKADQTNKLTDDEILDLRYCAHTIERICQSMKLGQKEFSRVSPYLIAILMRQFEVFTVYPAVKDPLLNGCYKMIDLCDEHGMTQLNSMFTGGSREIFKTVYDVYKKFYRYTGKV